MSEWIFGLKEILKHRFAHEMSISELARKSGVSRATLSRMINNHSNGINLQTISRICKALSCQPGDLFRPAVHVLDRNEARARAIKHLDN